MISNKYEGPGARLVEFASCFIMPRKVVFIAEEAHESFSHLEKWITPLWTKPSGHHGGMHNGRELRALHWNAQEVQESFQCCRRCAVNVWQIRHSCSTCMQAWHCSWPLRKITRRCFGYQCSNFINCSNFEYQNALIHMNLMMVASALAS